ncbi:MAG: TIGR00159 family protein [Candidatus Melainabacteria bacterium HGW-Melainabacteria-1]|nr:MAG: TIGR00159 family protein [Candidatus Melainabacteria bacterium HGW-Melainabacteria-1]
MILEGFQEFWQDMVQILAGLRWQDVLDVFIVSFVLYKIFSFIKETRAIHLIRGLLLLVVIYFIANNFLELKILTSVLQNAATLVIVAIPVLFQPELRRALSELGRGFSVFPSDRLLKGKELFGTIRILVSTAQALSEEKTGALIVIERKIGLNEHIESGVLLDGQISQELLHTIFFEGTPLHDGAVILRGNRLVAASVQLPLTESKQSPAGTYWGMRHRAALGISEQSDAGCLVVSEETGAISLIVEGKTHRNLTEENLERLLLELFQMTPSPSEGLKLRGLIRRDPPTELDEPKPAPAWLTSLGAVSSKLFFNLRFIAVAVAVIWGLAVGIWRAPTPPRLDLEAHSKEMLVPIAIQGKSDNLVIKIDPSQINLKIAGKTDQLEKLKPEEIRVYIEIEDTSTGEQILPVGVSLPPNVQIRDVVPRLVNVKIIKLR